MAFELTTPSQRLRRQFGFSLASVLFYVTVTGVIAVFLIPLIRPIELDTQNERDRITAETEENTVRELALRYGMTLSELESQDWQNPWGQDRHGGLDSKGRLIPGKQRVTGLFGRRPLTATYVALLGRSDMEPIGGSRINPKAKRDRNLWPLNTDYDLYSLGRDGKSSRLLSSPESQDDIIRANNGQFIGLASEY
ncbi:MAG: hypothetical protein V3W41_06610 [Planctomycetota bacterium]